ncbi:LysR family transcriptional regulator [Kineosporia succinea]|uniref:DNA-binding transcriptional LysR family regulator n=1 Tax=Kineosporia succinea TaxID=84632 RepID=A0ABT9PEB0_9ACTN|nr:LysR family transcriptional regulator [Kineosporia succinea]MDP9831052.1 DNA-binding transcriptional LysR family regulator [Kineosporia succinea]
MDLPPHLLRALLAVLDTGSFTAASERLGFTQSALSKQIAALESVTGATMFVRGPRGTEPSEAAHRLAARAAVILDQLDAARRELDQLAAPVSGRVALGGFPTTAMWLVPQAVARVRAEHPSVTVDFLESSTPVQIRRLRAGRLDLAILALGADLPDYDLTGVETEPLPSGGALVAVGRRHPLARSRSVTVDALACEDWIAGRGGRGEPQFGAWPTLRNPHVVAELADWSTRLGFVAAGIGITTVPALAARSLPGDVVALEVDDPAREPRAMFLAHVGALSGPLAVVRAALRQEAADLAGRGQKMPE